MARFHPLEVTDVHRDTRDAVVVTLAPGPDDEQTFDFVQGQYLTFRRAFDGEELRRSYSICAPRGQGVLRVGIKRVDGGAFSTWANEELKRGDTLEAMPPMGSFHAPLAPERARRHLAFAAGSGITPVLSLIATTLAAEPRSTFTLVYGNRSVASIMFREELEDLKNRYMGRLSVIHVLAGEAQEIELFSGRIDAEKCARLFDTGWVDIANVDMAFICGPEPMMLAIARVAARSRPRRGAHQVRAVRLLAAGTRPEKGGGGGRGERHGGALPGDDHARRRHARDRDGADGESVLEAALGAKLDAPYACKAGVCSTCRAMVLEGEVEMAKNHALEDYEVARGYVLTCQCYPLSDSVVVTYDQ